MTFEPTDVQRAWQDKGRTLGRELPLDAAAGDVVAGAGRVGLLDAQVDLLAHALAVEALAFESPSAGFVFALHTGVALALAHARDPRFELLLTGETVGAIALSSEEHPTVVEGRLTGRAAWVAPITARGLAVIGARTADVSAYAVSLESEGLCVVPVMTAALRGFVCAHLDCDRTPCHAIGATVPIMARLRVLVAAAGLGMGQRALREALVWARRTRAAAASEQTVQGLLADAATDLEAATMVTWKVASAPDPTLGAASMSKLAAGAAAEHAIERATQVIGAEAFRQGHIVERLAQDVRALELFAGRTEALRAAAAAELLPHA